MKKELLLLAIIAMAGYANAQIIITGIANDVKGADANYEYIQLLATEDIDFAKTSYALVTCTNAGTAMPNPGEAPVTGWATGGGRTYKFNLNTGNVKAGEFFYVGGSNKRINGSKSTDIKDAKWIRTIDYKNGSGDGFGEATGGLLPNSGNAGGIALFVGTAVEESSKPIDVVFFGGKGRATILNQALGRGYRVADNDNYNSNAGTQPFFLQGKNTYVISYIDPAEQGAFMMLGGEYDAKNKSWKRKRSVNYFVMADNTTVDEIEKGKGVTLLSK
ncbi:hypothetical protein [Pseudopedobacter sp.]|uniref:hypothetical protein n=1 Tax=Pseudopedobacter sp. TaxID=1936787 RepID=UPI00333F82C4